MSPKIQAIYKVDDLGIYGFFEEHRFLSNFHMCEVCHDGIIYKCTESAYQAAKTLDFQKRLQFMNMLPGEAKNEGRKLVLRNGWEDIKVDIMRELTLLKFAFYDDLRKKLFDTGSKYLEETNYWGDKFWGADADHQGLNQLGKILMGVRNLLK